MAKDVVRIGAGAGYGGDRFEPAIELIEKGNVDYLIYETVAERTVALYQQEKLKDPTRGFNPQIERRLRPVLKAAKEKGVKIITNMGAANPQAAVKKVKELAASVGVTGIKVAAVLGDDVYDRLNELRENKILENGQKVGDYLGKIVSANAYTGTEGILEALRQGADVILTGRVADPSLTLAPLMYEFGWEPTDWDKMGKGTCVGHLLECGGQVTGGYYAEPGYKDVPRPWDLGFPIAEVSANGDAVITKPEGSGGLVTPDTCKEQILYEIHDPASYLTPDCVADFTGVRFEQVGTDRVKVTGATGRERPETLKVSLGYRDSFIGEGQISYGGPGAVERARLGGEIVEKRLKLRNIKMTEFKIDLIGLNSLHGDRLAGDTVPYEVRLRFVGRTETKEDAVAIAEEVETLYTNGPAGGGGATKASREVLAIMSTFIPRNTITNSAIVEEV